MLNVALIGAGSHSTQNHAPSLRRFADEHPGTVGLAAVCDLDEAKAKRARHEFAFARSFTDVDEMFAAVELDAAVAVMPIPAILPVARQLLPRGIPLMIEKPLGTSLAEARELAAATREAPAPVVVSLNRRFDPAVRLALGWLASRGPVRALHGSMLRHHRVEPDFIWGTAIHLLDLMVHVAGPLRLRPAAAGVPPFQEGCARVATFDGHDGLVATVQILPCGGRLEERLRTVGDAYCVDVWTGAVHRWRVEAWHEGKLALEERSPEDEPPFVRNGAYNETAAFLEALAEQHPLPGPSLQDAMLATELAAELQGIT